MGYEPTLANNAEYGSGFVLSGGIGIGNATLIVPQSCFFAIQNPSTEHNISVTIGGITITLSPLSAFFDYFELFTSVIIAATDSYNWYTK